MGPTKLSITDVISSLEYKMRQKQDYVADTLLIDPNSLAILREELGISPEASFTRYHGLDIKVDPDETDYIRII